MRPVPERQCAPLPGYRSNESGEENRSGSRFADPSDSVTNPPAGIVTPPSEMSCVATRATVISGVSQRSPSSIARGSRLRSARTAASWSGCDSRPNSRLLEDRYVVSAPAGRSSSRNGKISSSLEPAPVHLGLDQLADQVVPAISR